MTVADWINTGIALATVAGVAFALIQFWLTRSEAKEHRLQDRAHKLATQLSVMEKRRIDTLFSAMAEALKQVQDRQKESDREFQAFTSDLRAYRAETKADRELVKVEFDHLKVSLGECREEVKGMVKYLGEGKFRVSGKKY